MTYKVFMRDDTTRTVEATCPTTAKWEAERLAIAGGINVLDEGAQARMARVVTTGVARCACGRRTSESVMCGRCHKAHMDALHVEARYHVATGACPDCGSKLRRNLAIAGWWTCEQRGAVTHRARPLAPECNFQTFTE